MSRSGLRRSPFPTYVRNGLLGLGIALVSAVALASIAEAAAPTVASVSPKSAVNSGTVKLTMSGSDLGSATTATLKRSGQADIVGQSLSAQSSTSATAVFDISAAAPGPWDVQVTNPEGTGTCSGCFTVAATGAPTVSAVSPDHVGQGATAKDLTITGTRFARGDTVTISGSGVTVNSTTFVSTTKLTANITVTSSAAMDARDVTVEHTSNYGSGSCPDCLTITAGPTTSSASPDTAGQGAKDLKVTITGTNFVETPAVAFSGSGIKVTDVTLNSATSLTATVDIDGSAATGSRSITVTNPDAGSATCSSCFTVNLGPKAVSVSPSDANGGQGASKVTITVNGPTDLLGDGNFKDGSKVSFSGSGITVTKTIFNENTPPIIPSTLTAEFDIAADAPVGKRDVIVTNPDGGRSVCSGCFTVNAGPRISELSPDAAGQNATGAQIKVTGANFASPTATFDGTGVTVNKVTQDSSTQLTLEVNVSAAATTGKRSLTVTNGDKGSTTCVDCFTINPKPTATSASPNRMAQGTVSRDIAITGSGFVGTPSVSFSGAGITVNKVVRDSDTKLTATLTLAGDAATGARDITVVNPDKGSATCTGCFDVTVGPTVTKATPSAGANTGSFTVKIDGTNFDKDAKVALQRDGQDDLPGTQVTVDSVTSLRATFDLYAAAPGPWKVRVTNPDHGSAACDCFSVAGAKPLVSSVSPSSRSQAASKQDVVITGQNFARGAEASFSGSGITVNSTTFVDTTHVKANISVASSAATGARDVTVTNTDGQSGKCTGCFTVKKRATVSLTPPSTLTGPVVAKFSDSVRGVKTSNFVLRLDGSTKNLSVKSLRCQSSSGASTSCSGSSVRSAKLTLKSSLISGQHYRAWINPSGVTPVLDSGGASLARTSKAFRASRVEQENSPGAKAAWGFARTSAAYGGSYTRERASSATATYSFTGTSITWYTVTGKDQGKANVYIDGKRIKTINNYSSSRRYKVARTFRGLSSASHTLRIVPTGEKGSSRGTSTFVSIDAMRIGSGSVVTSPKLAYAWQRRSYSAASGDRYARSNVKWASMSFTFHGTGVDWYTVFSRYNGKAKVYIDGKFVKTVNTYRSSTYVGKYSFRNLSHAVHTIKIVVDGTRSSSSRGTWVAVDRWIVR